jgi:hypothetical protein
MGHRVPSRSRPRLSSVRHPTGTADAFDLFLKGGWPPRAAQIAEEVALAKRIEVGDHEAKERMIRYN